MKCPTCGREAVKWCQACGTKSSRDIGGNVSIEVPQLIAAVRELLAEIPIGSRQAQNAEDVRGILEGDE